MTTTQRFERILKDLDALSDVLLYAKHNTSNLENKVEYARAIRIMQDAKGNIRMQRFEVEDAQTLKGN